MIRSALVASLALAVTAAMPAAAHIKVYTTTLNGAIESPNPVVTNGNGQVTVTVDEDNFTMRVQASFADLTGNVTLAHIHCCSASSGVGVPPPAVNSISAGVATRTPSFLDFPAGVKAGTYDKTFDMTQAASYNGAFVTANSNNIGTAFSALVSGLDGGKAYFNLHTSSFGGGEIRGFLAPIPEPETYALMLGGLGLVGAAALRRRAAR